MHDDENKVTQGPEHHRYSACSPRLRTLFRWYFRAWFEFNGAEVYAEDIKLIDANIEKYTAELAQVQAETHKAQSEIDSFDDKLRLHREV